MSRVLGLTGATGFIGSHVLQEALASGWHVRAVVRSPQRPVEGVTWLIADLGEAKQFDGVFVGATAIAHCANAIGSDRNRLEAVNVRGSEAVVAEARRHGIARLGILSTSAVYRRERHVQAREDTLIEDPGSDTSNTRLRAELAVREAGGFSVRPHLVTGPGDRWVVPNAARAVVQIGWPQALPHSFVDVRDLARLIVMLLDSEAARGATFHASYAGRTWRDVLEPLGVLRGNAARGSEDVLDPRHVALLAEEHTYSSERAWKTVGWTAARDPSRPDAATLRWYRRQLVSRP